MSTKVTNTDPVRPAAGSTNAVAGAAPVTATATDTAGVGTEPRIRQGTMVQDQQISPNQRAAATTFGLPAVAPPTAGATSPAPAAYAETFAGQSFLEDGKNPELLSLARRAAAADPALAAGSFGQSLQRGELSPEDMKTLQTSLQGKGYSVGNSGVDGKFGPETHHALSQFLTGAAPETPATPGTEGQTPANATAADQAAIERLRNMSAKELADLGRTNKQAFFDALRPAAEATERMYGVPAAVTLAQAGLESGYGTRTPGGNSFNFFGIKRNGPAGQVQGYARYHNAAEAIMEHGKLFHNGYYGKALNVIKNGGGNEAFLRSIEGVYHETGSRYTRDSMSIIRKYHL